MPNRQHKRLCAMCGKRHVKPTGRKCKMASQSPPVSTAPSASGNTNEAQSAMALTPVATSTTVTATTSFCTIGATTVTTTVSSAGSGGGMTSMAGPSIGSTLQVLAATLSTLSARMDSMESALHAHAAAPPAPGPPPPPASQPAQPAATPTGVVPTTAGQPHLAPSILPLHPHIAPTGAAPMTPPLPPPTSHPPQPAMGVATHAPAVHPVVPPHKRQHECSVSWASWTTTPAVRRIPTTHHHQGHTVSPTNSNQGAAGRPRTLWYGRWTGPISKCLRVRHVRQLNMTHWASPNSCLGIWAMPSNQTPLRGTVGPCCGICVISCTMPQCTHGRATAISTASSCAWWSTMRRPGLTKHWYRSYAPNTPGHQRPPQAMEATPHSRAPAQSSREGRVPTPRIMSRPMAAGFLMSVAGASVSGGNTISMRRRTVSLKRNGTQKTRKPGNTHPTLCSDDPWWRRPSPCGLTYSLW